MSEFDACEHGVSYDDDCRECDALTAVFQSYGAVTPYEIGIARRAYEGGIEAAQAGKSDRRAESLASASAKTPVAASTACTCSPLRIDGYLIHRQDCARSATKRNPR